MTRAPKGFTLVEILVAITMVALLLTAVYGVFTSITGAQQRLEREGEGYHLARVLFDRLGRELRGTYYLQGRQSQGGQSVRFKGGETTDGLPSLELTTTAGTPYGGGQGGVMVVSYVLRPDPEAEERGAKVLMRNEYSLFDLQGGDREGYRLAPGIGELKLRFFKDGQWFEEWDASTRGGLPELVEVSMTLPIEGEQVLFRTAFEIPAARSSALPVLGTGGQGGQKAGGSSQGGAPVGGNQGASPPAGGVNP